MGIRLWISGAFRRARAAESRGDLAEAAKLYLEASQPAQAVGALIAAADRSPGLERRMELLLEARRIAPDNAQRKELDARVGKLVLQDAQARGALTADDRRRLAEAAERLEEAGAPKDAATAWQLLGRTADVLRCLESAGDVERLEPLLEEEAQRSRRSLRLRSLVSDYELNAATGQRREADALLRQAAELAPDDASVRDLLRSLEAKRLAGGQVRLRWDGRETLVIGRLPVVLGRGDADLCVRGASVSRRHSEIGVRADKLVVRDLGSRNGTLVGGIAIGAELVADSPVVLGLGDDSDVRCEMVDTTSATLRLEVVRGLDRGVVAVAGASKVRLPGVAAVVEFGPWIALFPSAGAKLRLLHAAQALEVPRVDLLRGDGVEVDGRRLEVVS